MQLSRPPKPASIACVNVPVISTQPPPQAPYLLLLPGRQCSGDLWPQLAHRRLVVALTLRRVLEAVHATLLLLLLLLLLGQAATAGTGVSPAATHRHHLLALPSADTHQPPTHLSLYL